MTRLDRLVLNEIWAPFVFAALLFTGLVFAGGELIRYAEYLQQGQSLILIFRLFLYTIPGILALTFPMAMLLAALLGFGRLSQDSEIVALTAGGASFTRIAAPCIVFAACVSLAGFWFMNTVVPNASRARNVIYDAFKAGKAGPVTGERLTVPLRDDKGRLTTLVQIEGSANLASGELNDVSIFQYQNNRPVSSIFAPRAKWKVGTKDWTLEDYDILDWSDPEHIAIAHAAQGLTKEVTLDRPDQLPALGSRPEDIATGELQSKARALRAGGNASAARDAEVEIARRGALPFASLAFACIGAPLGVRPPREGRGVGFGLSIVITFLYWTSLQAVSVLGKGGALPASLALAIPNLACIFAGLYLIRRVYRP